MHNLNEICKAKINETLKRGEAYIPGGSKKCEQNFSTILVAW